MHPCVTTHESFFAKLLERFDVPPEYAMEKLSGASQVRWVVSSLTVAPVQRMVCQCVQEWIETNFSDFPEALVTRMEQWADELKGDAALRSAGLTLSSLLQVRCAACFFSGFLGTYPSAQNKRFHLEQEWSIGHSVDVSVLDASLLEGSHAINPGKLLEKFSEEDIAKQLTLTDFSIFMKIRPSELLDQAWNKAKYKVRKQG